ncbi:MAG: HAD hydrolase-like protein [Candidatus Altiarchaeia archaeon]
MDIPKNIKCVIFDMADTLANFPVDYPSMRGDLSSFIAAYGLKSDFKPIVQDIRSIAKNLNKKELIRDMFDIIDRYETQSVDNSTPLENTIDLYKRCITAKKKVAILTRNGDRMVKEFLKHYALPDPHLIVSRDSCVNLKPHTEQFDFLNAFFGFKNSEYMLVGDGYHDRHLAEKTGILFLDVKSRWDTQAGNHCLKPQVE